MIAYDDSVLDREEKKPRNVLFFDFDDVSDSSPIDFCDIASKKQ
jgi:hypothetical protein